MEKGKKSKRFKTVTSCMSQNLGLVLGDYRYTGTGYVLRNEENKYGVGVILPLVEMGIFPSVCSFNKH